MKVTQKSKLALVSLVSMAKNTKKRVRVQDLATEQNFTTHFLEQIFRNLRMAGIVRSVRGPGGGYELARENDKITVKDVLAALGEDGASWGENMSETPEAKMIANCLNEAEEKVRQIFANTTLAGMLATQSDSNNVVQFPGSEKRSQVA
jgi:Rrf2 family iron-sulfur cluster assembly transcriptional regulator